MIRGRNCPALAPSCSPIPQTSLPRTLMFKVTYYVKGDIYDTREKLSGSDRVNISCLMHDTRPCQLGLDVKMTSTEHVIYKYNTCQDVKKQV